MDTTGTGSTAWTPPAAPEVLEVTARDAAFGPFLPGSDGPVYSSFG